MIEKLDNAKAISLDFIQENTNRQIIGKINEIVEHINNIEAGKEK